MSQVIYLAGADGTGKSTQARMLIENLAEHGLCADHVWMRFPFFLSLPLLAFARWRGYSWYEEADGVRHGYWDFRRSWFLRAFLPWLVLFDALIAATREIYIPLWRGHIIVCERFVLDMLVDLAVGFGDTSLHQRLPGRLYLWLIPHNTTLAILDLDVETARVRRPDLRTDRNLEARLLMFRQICEDLALQSYSSKLPVADLNSCIQASARRMP